MFTLLKKTKWLAMSCLALGIVFGPGRCLAVTVVTPNGGETIAAGSVYDIEWTGLKGESTFTVRYSLDAGKSWRLVQQSVQGSLVSWQVPLLKRTAARCMIKVFAFDGQGRRLGIDRSDRTFTIMSVKNSDFSDDPQIVNPGFVYPEPPPLGRDQIPPDLKGDGTTYTENHAGLMCDNSILVEIGSHANAGSSASEIQLKIGGSFTIHLLGGAGAFVPGAALLYTIPGSCADCYKSIPADDWDNLRLVSNSGDGIQVHRFVLVKSCETVLDVVVDDWLDKHYQKVLDFSIDTAGDKWDDVGHTRVTDLYYAAQDLGQTGAKKYVNADVWWCSEFASYMIRKNGLSTPTGSIGTDDLKNWFQSHGRYHTRAEVEGTSYTVRAGDYMSLWDGGHSVLFRGWVSESPGTQGFDGDSEFRTIEGNSGNAVRTQTRKWSDVDFVGGTQ